MKRLAIFIVVLILGISAFGWYGHDNQKKTEYKNEPQNHYTKNHGKKKLFREKLEDGFLKPGEKFGEWIVDAVEKSSEKYPMSLTNFHAYFTGKVTISGRYFNQYDDMLDNVYFFPSKESLYKLPNIPGNEYEKPFIFRNKIFAESSFFQKGSYGKATVIISAFELIRYPSEFSDSAQLDKVVSKSEKGQVVYPKSLDFNYDDVLWKKYHSDASNLKNTYLKVGYIENN